MRKGNKFLVVAILILLLLGVTVGYSVLTTVLNISGVSRIKDTTWDIHFDNIQVKSGSVTPVSAPSITSDGLTITYNVNLDKPGDFYEFSFDVVNSGGIDSKLVENPEIIGVSTSQDQYVNYSFSDINGNVVREGDSILSGQRKTYKVRVEFEKNINNAMFDSISNGEELELEVRMNWQQA